MIKKNEKRLWFNYTLAKDVFFSFVRCMQSYKITSFGLEIKRDGNKDKKKWLKIALTTFCKDLRATAVASKSFFKDKLSNNTTMNAMFAIGIKKKQS